LLYQVDLGQSPDLVMEARHSDELGEHDPRIVETKRLVKIAGQKILLHHWVHCPFLIRSYLELAALSGRIASHLHLTHLRGLWVTNYFDGCYAQKREQNVVSVLDALYR